MNAALDRLASQIDLDSPANEKLRFAFAYECVRRIEHLLEEQEVIECLQALGMYVRGELDSHSFNESQHKAERLANQHRGSKYIDGCGHAAVSASYAVANAINGKPLQTASYAAYAKVYADGGYAAVAEPEAFGPEFSWQVGALSALVPGGSSQPQQGTLVHGAGVA